MQKFNGEECYGQYLDLTPVHRSLGAGQPEYLDFLRELERMDFAFVERGPPGGRLLGDIIAYLFSFVERSQPFFDIARFRARIKKEFADLGKTREAAGGPNRCDLCARCFATA